VGRPEVERVGMSDVAGQIGGHQAAQDHAASDHNTKGVRESIPERWHVLNAKGGEPTLPESRVRRCGDGEAVEKFVKETVKVLWTGVLIALDRQQLLQPRNSLFRDTTIGTVL